MNGRTPSPTVVVLDYGTGNVHSAREALQRAGANAVLTGDREAAIAADGLVVPGVGAFGAVLDELRAAGGERVIEQRLAGGRPVLGICVGLQVLFEHSAESGDARGLAQWPGTVERLDAPVLPHMGWNTVQVGEGSRLFRGVEHERFYFVHSYAVREWTLEPQHPFVPPVVTWADYGGRFVAAVENGPLTATQFHPEKSGGAGIRLLRNWIEGLPGRPATVGPAPASAAASREGHGR